MSRAVIIQSTSGEVYVCARHHLVDIFVGHNRVMVASIKGTRTLTVDPEEQKRVADQVRELYTEDDD